MLLATLISVSIWVSQDARKRGMSARWGIGVGLLLIVFLPLYFLVRRRTVKCAGCGNDIAASLSLCEECEQSIQQTGPHSRVRTRGDTSPKPNSSPAFDRGKAITRSFRTRS